MKAHKILAYTFLASTFLASLAASGQSFFFGPPTKGSGVNISGDWYPSSQQDAAYGTAAGPLVAYGGIPFNEAGRLYALAYDAARVEEPQLQCIGYGDPYMYDEPGNFRFWEQRNPYTQQLVAIHMYFSIAEIHRTVWMPASNVKDPPAWAPHTFTGLSTGKWSGNYLTITTDHFKRSWIRANGIPSSDQAKVIERLIRHGNELTVFAVKYDPVYLAAPFTQAQVILQYKKDPTSWLYNCNSSDEILGRPEDDVPNFLFGKNPWLRQFANQNKIPLLGTLGGPQTMRVGFQAKLKEPAATLNREALAETIPSGPEQSSVAVNPNPHDGKIHVWHVQGRVYMLIGDGGNIAVQVGKQGALLVGAGAGKLSDQVVAAVNKISDQPIQYIVDTSFLPDVTGGNANLAAAGEDPSLLGSYFTATAPSAQTGLFTNPADHATMIAQNNVAVRMYQEKRPVDMIPGYTYLSGRLRMYHNGGAVQMFYLPDAVTDADTIVDFRRSDVMATGDIFNDNQYPFIDVKHGGTIGGEIHALDFILSRTVYEHDEDGGTMIIPGHGRVCDEYDVVEYRDMLAIIRQRVAVMKQRGATLDQVLKAGLTADFDPRFGATSGPWTTNMFVAAVYNTLKEPETGK